jgi:DNA end-binding protein Ku
MARAIWKGVIKFGDVEVPVKLYSAVQDRGVHFRLLHDKDLQPIKQSMVNPVTGKVVDSEDVRRGFEVERGVFVTLEDVEIETLRPAPSRDIEVTRFVPKETIALGWYDRPYYLGPDEDDGAYFALVEALSKQERQGVARWVMRHREYTGALHTDGEHLMLITLRHPEEVVPLSAIEPPSGREADEREIRMAKQLVAALEDEFDPAAFRDEFRDRVLELVQAKAEGRTLKLEPVRVRKPAEKSLADMLERSLETTKREKAVA